MSEFADFLELDLDKTAKSTPTPEVTSDTISLDMVDAKNPHCKRCATAGPVNTDGLCEECFHLDETDNAEHAGEADGPVASIHTFAAIASEAAANANAGNLGELAVGRATLGVGFTSAAGYVEALKRGVLARTRTEYETTLRARYGFTSADLEKIGAVTIVQNLPVGAGIVHFPDPNKPTFEEQMAAHRAAAKVAAIAKANEGQNDGGINIAPVEVDGTVRVSLQHGALVAGAVAEGHGIITGWTGRGPLTHARLIELRELGGLMADADPKPKESKTQARRAVQSFATKDLLLIPERKAAAAGVVNASLVPHDGRWILVVGKVTGTVAAGEKYGEIKLVATLHGTSLTTEGDADLGAEVVAEYNRLTGEQLYQAPDVTAWLQGILINRFEAVRYGGNWYVARKHRANAERLITTLSAAWGDDWMVPALPVATSDQLAQGLANGLKKEVENVLMELTEAREIAKKSKTGDIGPKAANTFLLRFRRIGERVVSYGALIGAGLVDECRSKVRDAMATLNTLADDGGIGERFGLIWEEIEMDIRNKEGVL